MKNKNLYKILFLLVITLLLNNCTQYRFFSLHKLSYTEKMTLNKFQREYMKLSSKTNDSVLKNSLFSNILIEAESINYQNEDNYFDIDGYSKIISEYSNFDSEISYKIKLSTLLKIYNCVRTDSVYFRQDWRKIIKTYIPKFIESKNNNEYLKELRELLFQLNEDYFKIKSHKPIDMIYVKGGTFNMGSSQLRIEQPIHEVTVSDFYISKYETTQSQWNNLTSFKYYNKRYFKGDNIPVHSIPWRYAVEFCNLLSEKEGLEKCYSGVYSDSVICDYNANGYRLPTEAEWEFAAKGGILSKEFIYSGSNIIDDVCEYKDNNNTNLMPVGGRLPNELGIYDMSGNAHEWCWDRVGAYENINVTNPTGSKTGNNRIYRGCSYNTIKEQCRITYRFGALGAVSTVGFRVVRNLD